MKKEKGSALLTVVLIVAVTATIGVAVSSFILMNYRFRLYDTHIRRAEYTAEEIIDKTYLYVQADRYNKFQEMANNAWDSVWDDYYLEERRSVEGLAEGEELSFPPIYLTIDSYGNCQANVDEISKKAKEIYNASFIEQVNTLKSDIESVLRAKFTDVEIGDYKSISGNKSVDVGACSIDTTKITQPLNIYYKIPNNAVVKGNPWVRFSVNIIISKPEYEDVINTGYDIRNYVGISNWSIDNDWNI